MNGELILEFPESEPIKLSLNCENIKKRNNKEFIFSIELLTPLLFLSKSTMEVKHVRALDFSEKSWSVELYLDWFARNSIVFEENKNDFGKHRLQLTLIGQDLLDVSLKGFD